MLSMTTTQSRMQCAPLSVTESPAHETTNPIGDWEKTALANHRREIMAQEGMHSFGLNLRSTVTLVDAAQAC